MVPNDVEMVPNDVEVGVFTADLAAEVEGDARGRPGQQFERGHGDVGRGVAAGARVTPRSDALDVGRGQLRAQLVRRGAERDLVFRSVRNASNIESVGRERVCNPEVKGC